METLIFVLKKGNAGLMQRQSRGNSPHMLC